MTVRIGALVVALTGAVGLVIALQGWQARAGRRCDRLDGARGGAGRSRCHPAARHADRPACISSARHIVAGAAGRAAVRRSEAGRTNRKHRALPRLARRRVPAGALLLRTFDRGAGHHPLRRVRDGLAHGHPVVAQGASVLRRVDGVLRGPMGVRSKESLVCRRVCVVAGRDLHPPRDGAVHPDHASAVVALSTHRSRRNCSQGRRSRRGR